MDTVWGDLLFFVNFCMDFQCLFLTAKLLHRPFFVWRAALFAALGAIYAVAALFIQTSGVVAFLADCAVCLLMCVGTFAQKNYRTVRIFLPFLVYFGVSFAVGGAMSGMAALLSHIELPIGTNETEVSTGLFFLLAAAGGISTFLWGRTAQRRAAQMRARLRAGIGRAAISLCAMVDTANLLSDPISGKPVVIVSRAAMQELLPQPLARVVASDDISALGDLEAEHARRVRLLHAGSVTGEKLLFAISPDWAFLDCGKGEVAVDLLLAPTALHMGFDECEALLPAELIREI